MKDRVRQEANKWEDTNYQTFFATIFTPQGAKKPQPPYHGWEDAVYQTTEIAGSIQQVIYDIFRHHEKTMADRDHAHAKESRNAVLFQVWNVYLGDNLRTQINVAVEPNNPLAGDFSENGYSSVARVKYAFPSSDITSDTPELTEMLMRLSRRFFLIDKVAHDEDGVCLHYALIGGGDSLEGRIFDDDAWRIVAPNITRPHVYATQRAILDPR